MKKFKLIIGIIVVSFLLISLLVYYFGYDMYFKSIFETQEFSIECYNESYVEDISISLNTEGLVTHYYESNNISKEFSKQLSDEEVSIIFEYIVINQKFFFIKSPLKGMDEDEYNYKDSDPYLPFSPVVIVVQLGSHNKRIISAFRGNSGRFKKVNDLVYYLLEIGDSE